MYSDWFASWRIGLLFLAVFIWLGGLSYLFLQERKFLSKLFPKDSSRDIRAKFAEVLDAVGLTKKELGEVDDRLKGLERDGLKHIQKIVLLRYNPYEETGGDQSFSVVFLNAGGDGTVVTSLHTRSGTRVYAKPVTAGKAEKYPFSAEELQVVKKAMA